MLDLWELLREIVYISSSAYEKLGSEPRDIVIIDPIASEGSVLSRL
jgi:hypothetical protein